MPNQYHLAQLNVARMRGPIDSAVMSGFVAQLEHINAAADRATGFVWRLQTEDGDSTAIRATADPMIIVNMSVWKSVEALRRYVYQGEHLAPLRARNEWFEKRPGASVVLWWIPAGCIPRVEQGMARLRFLEANGPSAYAFTFAQLYPEPQLESTGRLGHEKDQPHV